MKVATTSNLVVAVAPILLTVSEPFPSNEGRYSKEEKLKAVEEYVSRFRTFSF